VLLRGSRAKPRTAQGMRSECVEADPGALKVAGGGQEEIKTKGGVVKMHSDSVAAVVWEDV
jgi:hypothetical protein